MKPYAESCDQNRDVILKVLAPLFVNAKSVLEIGSGTGQHAVYFAKHMPWLHWHTSDRLQNHHGIRLWIDESKLDNLSYPIALDVSQSNWPQQLYDAVFTANSFHIMHIEDVENTFKGLPEILNKGGLFSVYGPFNYNNQYTSDSNARFDAWLKQRDDKSGIRNFEDLDAMARLAGMTLLEDYPMPQNNRTICWKMAV